MLLFQSIEKKFQSSISFLIRNFHRKLTRETDGGLNIHRSNRAKLGLYHGKDVHSGHTISHSKTKAKRTWYPNSISKRVWSYGLSDWVRFNMTTSALKAIDKYGGVDNYVLSLDEKSVSESPYVTKMRGLIAGALFHQGKLSAVMTRRLGFDLVPPPLPQVSSPSIDTPTTSSTSSVLETASKIGQSS